MSLVELSFVKGYLSIPEEESTYDEIITFTAPVYSQSLLKRIDKTEEEVFDDIDLQMCLSAQIGCHITRVFPLFEQVQKSYKVGDIEESFRTQRTSEPKTWCELYRSLLNDVLKFYGGIGSVEIARQGQTETIP